MLTPLIHTLKWTLMLSFDFQSVVDSLRIRLLCEKVSILEVTN